MALLLHLTDLHLDERPEFDTMSDNKVSTVTESSRPGRVALMKSTLAALRGSLAASDRDLDSIVITGDITNGGRAEGFGLLDGVLDALGDKRPAGDRILIVPGNHDVVRDKGDLAAVRYEGFLTLRPRYLTAWLEGIDVDDQGSLLPKAATAPILVAEDESFILVGINSSNYSGRTRPTEDDLVKHLVDLRLSSDEGVQQLLAAWEKRGEDDMARVDIAQQVAVGRLLAQSNLPPGAVRIAAFHHHLVPISGSEEVKTFETMTNLGAFQEWLVSNGVSTVLHGHKHVSRVLRTTVTPAGSDVPATVLVVSGPAIVKDRGTTQPFARLIETDPTYARARPLVLTDVPTTAQGIGFAAGQLGAIEWSLDVEAVHGRISGSTAREVHYKLRALDGKYAELPIPLICRIEEGESALEVPDPFPDYAGFEPAAEWFMAMVEWWQKPSAGRAAPFNHGERLYGFGPDHHNQVADIVTALKDRTTTRALATLFRPTTDPSSENFPSFTLVHFLIRDGRLDVIAYYRKQEMPHWWPVNVAELATIQTRVLQDLADEDLVPGSITTVTAKPTSGRRLPKVAVPWIDRRADDGELLPLVLPFFSDGADSAALHDLWEAALSDWIPAEATEAADGNPLPVIGLTDLLAEIQRLETGFGIAPPEAQTLRTSIEAMEGLNARRRGEKLTEAEWLTSTKRTASQVREIVSKISGRSSV